MAKYYYCAYDDAGDLFVDGRSTSASWFMTELPEGGSTFNDIALDQYISNTTKIQWDGGYLTFRYDGAIYQVSVSGSDGMVKGTVPLSKTYGDAQAFWIQGNKVVAPFGKPLKSNNQRLGYWSYPAGGMATKTLRGLTTGRKDQLNDVTVSSS
jgi:hypothetical protein